MAVALRQVPLGLPFLIGLVLVAGRQLEGLPHLLEGRKGLLVPSPGVVDAGLGVDEFEVVRGSVLDVEVHSRPLVLYVGVYHIKLSLLQLHPSIS
jgi:hypothetical protein